MCLYQITQSHCVINAINTHRLNTLKSIRQRIFYSIYDSIMTDSIIIRATKETIKSDLTISATLENSVSHM